MKKIWNKLKPLILKYDKYFFDFILLFAAVFSGFLADNYRESLEKRKVERHIITDIINDLNADIELSEKVIEDYTSNKQGLDTLIKNFWSILDSSAQRFLDLSAHYGGWEDYYQSTSGFDQLKNGGYSLIRSKDILDSIIQYNSIQDDIRGEITNLRRHIHLLWDAEQELISIYTRDSLRLNGADLNKIKVREILMPEQPIRYRVHKYYHALKVVRANFTYHIRFHNNNVKAAKNLIALLEEEYGI